VWSEVCAACGGQLQRPTDFAGRFRGVDLGEWHIDGVPRLTTRAHYEQPAGPAESLSTLGIERADVLCDGAQTQDGQMKVAVECSRVEDGPQGHGRRSRGRPVVDLVGRKLSRALGWVMGVEPDPVSSEGALDAPDGREGLTMRPPR
jgi:hypothetical protein